MGERGTTEKLNKRAKGKFYEERAAEYLQRQGMKILCRNFRCRQGEIDLVGMHQGTLVFVEVKFRQTSECGKPEEAVDEHKQKRICRTAAYYVHTHPFFMQNSVRYDVVAMEKEEIRWYPAAFEHKT